jgi:hypothetical protein
VELNLQEQSCAYPAFRSLAAHPASLLTISTRDCCSIVVAQLKVSACSLARSLAFCPQHMPCGRGKRRGRRGRQDGRASCSVAAASSRGSESRCRTNSSAARQPGAKLSGKAPRGVCASSISRFHSSDTPSCNSSYYGSSTQRTRTVPHSGARHALATESPAAAHNPPGQSL